MNDKEKSISNLKAVYDSILIGHREPMTIFLAKPENTPQLTSLIVALNYFVKALDAEEMSGHMDRTMIARKSILADLKRRALENDKAVWPLRPEDEHRWHKPQDNYYSGAGSTSCPVCETGKLQYSRSAYNGHVNARCSTDGCVAWME